MGVEFHCEHCNKTVRAPVDAAGHQGKCPYCGGKVYIPARGVADEGDLPLAPLDPEDERRRLRAQKEVAELQTQMLHDQALPGERKSSAGGAQVVSGARTQRTVSLKEVTKQVVAFVEAMAGGRLNEAQKLAGKIVKQRVQALSVLDGMATDDLAAYGLPVLPRPVVMGFLQRLRKKVQNESG